MSTAIKRRRGTAAEHSSFAGLEGELTVNTTNDSVHVHDGTTAGGHELARADLSNVDNITPTATGIDVTGTATMDGLTVTDTSSSLVSLMEDTSSGADVEYNGATNNFVISTGTSGSGSQTPRLGIARDTGDISFYEDTGTTAKFFWDASAESLGIGTSSPNAPLSVRASSPATTVANMFDSAGFGFYFKTSNIAPYPQMLHVGGSESLAFGTNGATERMRIDSSGNLLVGKTSADSTTVGVEARGSGILTATRDSGTPVFFGRNTTDGDVVVIQKGATTVGSIGTEGGDLVLGTGSTAGIQFNDATPTIRPWNMSANTRTDGVCDLGYSNSRFKDLYLSGGVYLGGTGSANYLDDYEEGTWTGVLKGGTVVGNSPSATGTYTKVGNVVTVVCRFTNLDTTGATGQFQIHGLPFTAVSGPAVTGSVWNNRTSTTGNMVMEIPNGYTQANAYDGAGATKNWLSSGATYVGFTAVYRAA